MNVNEISLSESFHLGEFLVSQQAARMGREIVPTQQDIDNLRRLCVLVLQPLRHALGRVVVVSSGLRPPWLNANTPGSSRTSAHIWGGAADVIVPGLSPLVVCRKVVEMRLPVDQCIHEYPPGGWCHVGLAPIGMAARGEYLTVRASGGRTIREQGINA